MSKKISFPERCLQVVRKFAFTFLFATTLLAGPAVPADVGTPGRQAEIEALVFRVFDGDTVLIRIHNQPRRFHLFGVDAPELDQNYGRNSQRGLQKLVLGKRVLLRPTGAERDGDPVALVELAGEDVSIRVLNEGFAWVDRSSDDAQPAASYSAAEQAARDGRRGLWVERDPTPPWVWRQLR